MKILVGLVLLAACGGKQAAPAADPEPVASLDAAPAPVVIAPADAAPPPPPRPPEVPAQVKSTDVEALRAQIKDSNDDRQRLIWSGWIAEALWAQSCPSATGGLCLKTTARAKKAPPTCDQHTDDVVAKGRPKTQTDEVWKVIAEMRQLWGDGAVLTEITDVEAQADAYIQNRYVAEELAAALLILGDHELEQLYALAPPMGLEVSGATAKASEEKFRDWFAAVGALGLNATKAYQVLLFDPQVVKWAPSAKIDAIDRLGTLALRMGSAVLGLEISKNVQKTPELVEAYCDVLSERAAPLLAQAAELFARCASTAGDLGVDNDTVARCAAEAERLAPAATADGYFSVDADVMSEVFVDGKSVGFTPLKRLALAPGTYQVRVEGPGDIKKFDITIDAGKLTDWGVIVWKP